MGIRCSETMMAYVQDILGILQRPTVAPKVARTTLRTSGPWLRGSIDHMSATNVSTSTVWVRTSAARSTPYIPHVVCCAVQYVRQYVLTVRVHEHSHIQWNVRTSTARVRRSWRNVAFMAMAKGKILRHHCLGKILRHSPHLRFYATEVICHERLISPARQLHYQVAMFS